jgi:hypothetical protein
MKAISVPLSVVVRCGFRLDARPYIDAAYNTLASVRAQAQASARHAYWKAARRGVARMHNVEKFRKEMGLDKVVKI